MFVTDTSVNEVQAPHNLWCASGHITVAEWSRGGAGTPAAPTRFFRISSQKHNISGVYCELCLTIANATKKK